MSFAINLQKYLNTNETGILELNRRVLNRTLTYAARLMNCRSGYRTNADPSVVAYIKNSVSNSKQLYQRNGTQTAKSHSVVS